MAQWLRATAEGPRFDPSTHMVAPNYLAVTSGQEA